MNKEKIESINSTKVELKPTKMPRSNFEAYTYQ